MDVAVIGAGISGLLSAYHLITKGVNVTIFERRDSFPRAHCTGIVSRSTLENIPYANNFVVGRYNKVAFYLSIHGKISQINIRFRGFVAYKIDRYAHEIALIQHVKELGVPINPMSTVLEINEESAGTEVEIYDRNNATTKRQLFDKVVVAEGYPGTLSAKIGCKSFSTSLHAIQRDYVIRGDLLDEHTLYIYIDPHIFGYGFAWLVPFGDGKAVIGYAGEGVPSLAIYTKVVKFFSNTVGVDVKEYVSSFYGGNVLIGYPIEFFSKKGKSICIGDAVAMVKSISGGGLYAISSTSKMLSDLIIREDRKAVNSLYNMAKELRKQYHIKKLLWKTIPNPIYGRIISLLTRHRTIELEAKNLEYFDKHEKVLANILLELYKLFEY